MSKGNTLRTVSNDKALCRRAITRKWVQGSRCTTATRWMRCARGGMAGESYERGSAHTLTSAQHEAEDSARVMRAHSMRRLCTSHVCERCPDEERNERRVGIHQAGARPTCYDCERGQMEAVQDETG